MAKSAFVHLHNHSEYSLLDGAWFEFYQNVINNDISP